ncbi:MAG: ribonuclease H family protein [Fusobacterium sp.]|uniref:ribonuclease H family protein n=1 Tax=Fusobacterium sp. TaxID=68766 RepID=UPI0026DD1A8C|nr:ribonuclease H family protein [Fusobacterium sp.]MDO4690038.1 ribonuclease H family protein [Fusobacterium sp.]
MAKKFYAYFLNENNYGIVNTWDECKSIVQNSKARYKSFSSYDEAKIWLENGAEYENKKIISNSLKALLKEGVYFDAGTGRGQGVEVRITDKEGNSLIYILKSDSFNNFLNKNSWFINEFDNIQLTKDKTNNFGELLGLYLALECAKKTNLNKVFGDSQLVINYWSKGQYQENNLAQETISLIKKVAENRKKFEFNNASVEYISGDINPADLGFHK